MTVGLGLALLVVYALAVTRVTGLVVEDELTRRPREWIGRRLRIDQGHHRQIGYLASCPWCASIYVGAVMALLAYRFGTAAWMVVPALALAFSQVAGMTSRLGRS